MFLFSWLCFDPCVSQRVLTRTRFFGQALTSAHRSQYPPSFIPTGGLAESFTKAKLFSSIRVLREKPARFSRWYGWMRGRVCGSIRVTAYEPKRRRFHRHTCEFARTAPRRGGPAE